MGRVGDVGRLAVLGAAALLSVATAGDVGPIEGTLSVPGPAVTVTAADPVATFRVRFQCLECAEDHWPSITLRAYVRSGTFGLRDRLELAVVRDGAPVEVSAIFVERDTVVALSPDVFDLCTSRDCTAEADIEFRLITDRDDSEITLTWFAWLRIHGDGEPNEPPPTPIVEIVPP